MKPVKEKTMIGTFWLKRLLVVGLIMAVTSSCESSSPNIVRPTEVVLTELIIPSPTASPTIKPESNTPTDVPEPTQLDGSLTVVASRTPQPTTTITSQPTLIQNVPIETTIPLSIPVLERTLSLQTPFLEGQDVLALQEQLLLLGYTEVGTVDGVFGSMTASSVKQFQTDQGLVVDGIVGEQTWQSLFQIIPEVPLDSDSAASFSYSLGSNGSEVKELKSRLQELGYPICETDRNYSAQTEFAVRQFQTVNGLDSDGIVGPKTWELLLIENAQPLPLPKSLLTFSSPVEVGGSDDIAYDGKYLWLAAFKNQSFAVWSVNLENGAFGRILGVCATELAYDGKWVWVSQLDKVVAVDPESNQVVTTADINGYLRALTSNGKKQIWMLTSYNADTFLQSLKTR